MNDELAARLEELEKAASAAMGQYTAARRKLFLHGSPLLPPAEHAAALKRLEAERAARLTPIWREAEALERTARDREHLASKTPPWQMIPTGYRHAAEEVSRLIEREVSRLSSGAVADRLRYSLQFEEIPEQFALWQAIKAKRTAVEAASTSYDAPLRELEDHLFAEKRSEAAKPHAENARRARKVAERAYAGRYGATDAASAFVSRTFNVRPGRRGAATEATTGPAAGADEG